MISPRDLLSDALIYMGIVMFWGNIIIAFIMWDMPSSAFRAIIVFAIMYITGKYLKETE